MDITTLLDGHEKKDDIVNYVSGLITKMKLADQNRSKFENQYNGILDKLSVSGIDLDNLEDLKANAQGKSEVERKLNTLTTQFNNMKAELEGERKKITEKDQQLSRSKLISEFLPDMSKNFGKITGELLVDKLISQGKIRYDESGAPIYESETGILKKSEAIEKFKVEYASELRPSENRGPGGQQGKVSVPNGLTNDDLLKMSPSELFAMGSSR